MGTLLLVVCFCFAVFSEAAFASTGFGPALITEIGWMFCAALGISSGDLESAVLNVIATEAIAGVVQLAVVMKHCHGRLCVIGNISMVLSMPLGTWMLETFGTSIWMKRILGGIFLFIALYQAVALGFLGLGHVLPEREALEGQGWRAETAFVCALLASGITRASLGVAGPPVMILLTFFSLDKDRWRFFSCTNRVTMCCVQVLLMRNSSAIQAHHLSRYVVVAVGGLIGLALGNMLSPKIDTDLFNRILFVFLISGSLQMLLVGFPTLSMVAVLCVGLTGCGWCMKCFDGGTLCQTPQPTLELEALVETEGGKSADARSLSAS